MEGITKLFFTAHTNHIMTKTPAFGKLISDAYELQNLWIKIPKTVRKVEEQCVTPKTTLPPMFTLATESHILFRSRAILLKSPTDPKVITLPWGSFLVCVGFLFNRQYPNGFILTVLR